MYFNFSHLSLQKQVLLLIVLILILLLALALYTVKMSISRSKPLSTGFITISKAPKYKRKKIVQKLVQIVLLIIKKIPRFKISREAHNKQNGIPKK